MNLAVMQEQLKQIMAHKNSNKSIKRWSQRTTGLLYIYQEYHLYN